MVYVADKINPIVNAQSNIDDDDDYKLQARSGSPVGWFTQLADFLADLFDKAMMVKQAMDIDNIRQTLEIVNDKIDKQVKYLSGMDLTLMSINRKLDGLDVFAVGEIGSDWTYSDGTFVRLIKILINNINYHIDAIGDKLDVFVVGEITSGWSDRDGAFLKVIKLLTNSINGNLQVIADRLVNIDRVVVKILPPVMSNIDAVILDEIRQIKVIIKNINLSGSGGDGIVLPDIVQVVDHDLILLMQQLIDLVKNIDVDQVFNKIINKDKGTTIWDFFNRILDFFDNLLDNIIYLLVPESTDFINAGFKNLSEAINDKFAGVNFLQNIIIDVVSVDQRQFDHDYVVDLPLWGQATILKVDYINEFLPIFRRVVAAFLILATVIWSYKKITNGVIS